MTNLQLPTTDFFASLPLTLPASPYPESLTLFLLLLILSESRSFYPGSGIFKLLTSLSFLLGGFSRASTPPLLRLGLILSLFGDAFLIPSKTHYFHPDAAGQGLTLRFRLGTLSFGLAHIAYAVAFVQSSAAEEFVWASFAKVAVPGVVLAAVIAASVKREERPLVMGYAGVIMAMVGAAAGTGGGQRLVGAMMFLVSDLFVAADTFDGDKGKKAPMKENVKGKRVSGGRNGWIPRAVGWVLYFWAQMVLAGCI
ncbi:hypothetical protein EX30DRAFT_348013 [Ascodesmis nigricans]|uniref:YhhN-like protein n=1 Tax=Ascodesmis nigricans TaxID=341454 RepID=A0A4S2MZF7_9PEZI|nr:hypothetical protein EX30DRAFT_348013 [Ascodesmis nigricans]